MAALQVAGNPIMRDVSAPGRFARNLTFAQFIKSLGSISGPYLTTSIIALGFAWHRIFPVFAAVTLVTLVLTVGLEGGTRGAGGGPTGGGSPAGDGPPPSVAGSFALLAHPSAALAAPGLFPYPRAQVGLHPSLPTPP